MKRFLAVAAVAVVTLAACKKKADSAPAADSSMMSHDSAQMSHDSGMMAHDSTMLKKDTMPRDTTKHM